MGDPKKPRKKYETPRFPWRSDVLENELRLIGEYGLRNKRELWRHRSTLSRFRGLARSLLSMSASERSTLEIQILHELKHLNILPENAVLDDVLDLGTESILERRIQTIIFRKGLANTINQSRQLITHGHIIVDNRKVLSPSFIVSKEQEDMIAYAPASPIQDSEHPLRKSIESNLGGQSKDE